MTFWEYQLRMKAFHLRMVDKEYLIHLQAWVNRGVKAEKKSGRKRVPIYHKFEKFFDYEGRIKQVLGMVKKKPVSTTASRYVEYMKERRRVDGEL